MQRVRQVLHALREQLPEGGPLSALHITFDGDTVVVKEERTLWDPQSGPGPPRLRRPGVGREGRAHCPSHGSEAGVHRALGRRMVRTGAGPGARYNGPCHGRLPASPCPQPGPRPGASEPGPAAARRRGTWSRPRRTTARLWPPSPNRRWPPSTSVWRWRTWSGSTTPIKAYERALRWDPDMASAHYNLSRLYEAQGRSKEALRHLADYKRLV